MLVRKGVAHRKSTAARLADTFPENVAALARRMQEDFKLEVEGEKSDESSATSCLSADSYLEEHPGIDSSVTGNDDTPDIGSDDPLCLSAPVTPESLTFLASLLLVDPQAVCWVLPDSSRESRNLVREELRAAQLLPLTTIVLSAVVAVRRLDGQLARARVLEVREEVQVQDLDHGDVFHSPRVAIFELPSCLSLLPALALPLKLCGLRRVASLARGEDLWQQFEIAVGAEARCRVLLPEKGLGLPLAATVLYRVPGDGEVNLGLLGVELELLEVVTTWEEWRQEVGGLPDTSI